MLNDLKVLRIVTTMDPKFGGVVEAINSVARQLTSSNMTIDVLCFDNENSHWLQKTQNHKVYGLGKRFTKYSINFSYINWLRKNARKYDLVIIDGIWQFHTLGGYCLKVLGVPYCVFTHGMLDPYFNKSKLKYLKKLPIWLLIERNVIALAGATLFTCEEEKLLAQKSFPFYTSTPKIATLGVSAPTTDKAELSSLFYGRFPFLKGKRLGLFLSRIHQKKGIDLLISAFDKLKALPDDFDLVIAGPDNNNMKINLIKLCPKHLLKRIHWVGMLDGDIKWGAFYACEAFILPSHQENFGIVVAEALSTGTPVLITNKVNIWREIEAAGAGLVENDDVEGITKLLNQWFNLTAEEKRDMASKAKNCYQNNFSIESAVTDLESVFLDVISTANENES